MMLKQSVILSAVIFRVIAVHAAVTNVVDIGAIVAAANEGKAETNGWSMSGLSSYTDGSLKFPVKDAFLLSPDFGADVMRLDATVRCSSTAPTRWLYVLGEDERAITNFAACARNDRLEEQSLELTGSNGLSRFKLLMTGHGNTGVWALGSLSVVTADPISSPFAFRVEKAAGHACVLSWTNGEHCVSNRVDAYEVKRDISGETVVFREAFDSFSAGGNPVEKTDDLPSLNAALSGVRVYAQANTEGICQIATGSESGFLRHSGFADYSGMSLKLVLKRYPGDNSRTRLAWESAGVTNIFAEIELEDDFAEAQVSLDSLPGGAAILMGYDTVKSSRRVLMDSFEIVRSGAETLLPLGSRLVVAGAGPVRFSTRGAFEIAPRTTCRFFVYAFNAEGVASSPSSVETRLTGGGGFCLVLQ